MTVARQPVGSAWVETAVDLLDPERRRVLYVVLAAVVAAAFTAWATVMLPFYPEGWRWLAIALVAVAALRWPGAAPFVTSLALFLPLAYGLHIGGDGLLLAITAVLAASIQDAFTFLVLLTTLAAVIEPGLAPLLTTAPLALGVRRLGLASIKSVWISLAGLVLLLALGSAGAPPLSGLGSAPVVVGPTDPVRSLLDWGWLAASLPGQTLESEVLGVLRPFAVAPILLGQVAMWWAAAGLASTVAARTPRRRAVRWPLEPLWPVMAVAGLLIGGFVLAFGTPLLESVLTSRAPTLSLEALLPRVEGVALAVIALPVLRRFPVALGVQDGPRRPGVVPGPSSTAASRDDRTYTSPLPRDRWEDLGGIDSIREEIVDAVASQFDPVVRASLERVGLPPVRGVLLFGPPGTGKTKIARTMAAHAGVTFLSVSGSEFQTKWFGESEANLRRIFDEARARRPAILFFDEIEAFLPKRSQLSRSDAPEKAVVATFLGLVDGAVALDGVMLVGATNYPNLIDEAAIRPGRFDKLIYVAAPDRDGRREIFERQLAGRLRASDIDLDELAARTERFSGADIAAVCAEAARRTLTARSPERARPRAIAMADLVGAIAGARPSVTFEQVREYEAIADRFGRRSNAQDQHHVIDRPSLGWDAVAGLEDVKVALREAIELPLEHPDLVKEYGIRPPRGVLLFGPPGCGKTFVAKVAASAAGAHFLDVRGPEFLEGRVGASEAQLRKVFERARENAPCVLFFDEIDAIAGARGRIDVAAPTQILTQLLVEMDGFEELRGVVVVAATNRPDALDPALMRPGRFDRLIYVPPPDEAARRALFVGELARRPHAEDFDAGRLAKATDGYTGADIAAICGAAAVATARRSLATGQREVVTMDQLMEEIRRTPPSLSPEQLGAYEAMRRGFER